MRALARPWRLADGTGQMQTVLRDCYGQDWIDDHFATLDAVLAEYN